MTFPLKISQSELEFFTKEDNDKARQFYRGAYHRDPAGVGGWIEDGGGVPQASRKRRDGLLEEGDRLRHGLELNAQAEGVLERGQANRA